MSSITTFALTALLVTAVLVPVWILYSAVIHWALRKKHYKNVKFQKILLYTFILIFFFVVLDQTLEEFYLSRESYNDSLISFIPFFGLLVIAFVAFKSIFKENNQKSLIGCALTLAIPLLVLPLLPLILLLFNR